MTYFNVSIEFAQTVPGLEIVLQFAEMMQSSLPTIAIAFANYGICLIDNFMVSIESQDPAGLAARNILKGLIAGKPCADAETLDSFGSKVMIAADISQNRVDLIKLAYIAFAATSVYGPMKNSTQNRLNRCTQILEEATTQAGMGDMLDDPSLDIPTNTPAASNPYTPQPAVTNSYYQPEPSMPTEDPKHLKLAKIAQEAFREGAYDIALTAVMAAMKELEGK